MAKERNILKKEIYDEIKGVGRSGFESGMWFTSFRDNYFEKIQDEHDKDTVRDILAKFLKNEDYDASFLSKVAHIYADLEIPGYEDEIRRLSTDKRISGSLERNWFKMLLDDIAVEKELISGLSQIKSESNPTVSQNLLDEAITFFKKLRGDVSKMYSSKEAMEKTEPDFLRSHIYYRLIKLLRSERCNPEIKTRIALILSDLGFRHATKEIEKLLRDPQIATSPTIGLITQALARLNQA